MAAITHGYSASGGVWTSSNASVATIGTSSGIVVELHPATAIITYTIGGTLITTRDTVSALPAAISGTTYMIAHSTTALSSSPSGGTWSSSNTAVASVNSAGLVTAIAPGTTIISYALSTGCSQTVADTVISLGPGIISTYTGTGAVGPSAGDGGLTTLASVWWPEELATDAAGNLYIVENPNNKIRKVTPGGVITTIIGDGTPGFAGDGGPATDAKLYWPKNICLDRAGNIYIGDGRNYRIRKVNTSGIISTIAGNGTLGYTGDGGAATAAQIGVWGLAVDRSANVYFADAANSVIRKISTAGNITTFAGGGASLGDGGPASSCKFTALGRLTTDTSGNIYICDLGRIRKINIATGIVTTIIGTGTEGYSGDGGAATAALVSDINAITVDDTGNIYFSDARYKIRKVNTSGIISTIAGLGTGRDGGPALTAAVGMINGLTVNKSGQIFLSDYDRNRVRLIGPRDYTPFFLKGNNQNLKICKNSIANDLTSALAVLDYDATQTETWSLVYGPSHGSALVAYSAVSTGSELYPTGLSFTPDTGYLGPDSFKVMISDGHSSFTTTIRLNVFPLPGAITGVTDICAGGSSTLFDTSMTGGWVWSSSNTTVAIINPFINSPRHLRRYVWWYGNHHLH